jgi:hypothetical protein
VQPEASSRESYLSITRTSSYRTRTHSEKPGSCGNLRTGTFRALNVAKLLKSAEKDLKEKHPASYVAFILMMITTGQAYDERSDLFIDAKSNLEINTLLQGALRRLAEDSDTQKR